MDHPMDLTHWLHALDRQTLVVPVRRALRCETAEVLGWDYERIGQNLLAMNTGGLYRFHGKARDRGQTVEWSLVLKSIQQPGGGSDSPSHHAYWRREVEVYQSDLLDDLPEGLAAPRCFGTVEMPGGGIGVWLEEIIETPGGDWPLARYALAARHLGRFNGVYLTDRPLPSYPWLTRRKFHDGFAGDTPLRDCFGSPGRWDHPAMRRAFRPPVADDLLRLRDDHPWFLDALDRLPQTLCHHDAWRANLLSRLTPQGEEETVAVDWALVGIGAIGQPLGELVFTTLLLYQGKVPDAAALRERVFEGYLEGLRDVGWHGDPRLARLGFAASAVFHAGCMLPWIIKRTLEEHALSGVERRWARPLEELLEHWAERANDLLVVVEEARSLVSAFEAEEPGHAPTEFGQ
jgi:hypothetical protein